MPFNVADLHAYWKAFRTRHPQWELEVRQLVYLDPFARLRSGEFDVLVLWPPIEEPDFTVGPTLMRDPRILAVTAEHPLAQRSSVRLEMCSPTSSTPCRPTFPTTGSTATCPSTHRGGD
ncbi:LysR substrate-binding domain-containing protein [Streptomyces hundungensis]|uniref:LysR substrate-binding domain-containing protein n=1 Tax=Streptomyces hundungensis TaxID=1077946 RepID=UPI003D17023A